jgi:hypothetical protein
LSDAATARLIDESIEPILEMAAGDGDAVCGDGPAPPAITNPQSLLEDGLHPRGKPGRVNVRETTGFSIYCSDSTPSVR